MLVCWIKIITYAEGLLPLHLKIHLGPARSQRKHVCIFSLAYDCGKVSWVLIHLVTFILFFVHVSLLSAVSFLFRGISPLVLVESCLIYFVAYRFDCFCCLGSVFVFRYLLCFVIVRLLRLVCVFFFVFCCFTALLFFYVFSCIFSVCLSWL